MNCEYCGSRIFDSDRVCDRCGAPNIGAYKIPDRAYGVYGGVGNQQMVRYTSASVMNVYDDFVNHWNTYRPK